MFSNARVRRVLTFATPPEDPEFLKLHNQHHF